MAELWTDKRLDDLRHVGDPHGDDVVARFFQERASTPPQKLVAQLAQHDQLPADQRSPIVDAYLQEKVAPPAWRDEARLAQAQELFGSWGLQIGTALFCASLPEAYAAKKGVQVLHLTSRLATDTERRIYETAQMIIDTLAPGGLDEGAPGYVDVRRVRLMHAAVRHLILDDPAVKKTCAPDATHPFWCPDWGTPVNQEDLLGTLMTFTIVVFQALDRFGIRLSRHERESYLHAWNLVGYLLGIQEELLPITLDGAEKLAALIERRQRAACPEGREMAGALVGLLQKTMPTGLDDLPPSLIRYLRGNRVADILGVKRGGPVALLFGPLRLLSGVLWHLHQDRVLRAMSANAGRILLDGFLLAERKGERAAFSVPTSLATTWKLRAAGDGG